MTQNPLSSTPTRARGPALRQVTEEARLFFGARAAAAITVSSSMPVLIVGTSQVATRLDRAQWDACDGPGVDAMEQLQVFNIADLAAARSWPQFSDLARARGVLSSLAVPITWRGRALGALNLYSPDLDGFAGCEPLGLEFATAAAVVLSTPMAEQAPRTPRRLAADGARAERAVS